MSRIGRPRKTPVTLAGSQTATPGRQPYAGLRYPSGKLKPANKQVDGTPQAKIKRAVDLALIGAADPMLGTPVGWLRLHGTLTDTQTAAATHYAKIRGKADRAYGLRRRTAASPAYDAGFGSSSSSTPDDPEKDCRRYTDLRSEIRRGRPYMQAARVLSVLDAVCVECLAPASWDVPLLRVGLDIAAVEFGLTGRYRK